MRSVVSSLLLLGCMLSTVAADDEESVAPWIANGGFVLLVLALGAMFWGLAVIVEEFFVPALNVMCIKLGIPDDVAGATFMAAGASSPEMFASFVSLFITHSSLGAGTIIGSEIFNHLIICAGSVMYSKNGVIQLDARILMREVIFYGIALALLLYALSVSSEDSNHCKKYLNDDQLDDDNGYFCIDYTRPIVLICGYVMYALVCSYYTQIIALVCPYPEGMAAQGEDAEEVDPLVRDSVAREPKANFVVAEAERESIHLRMSQQLAKVDQENPMHGSSGTLEVEVPAGDLRATTGGNVFMRGSSALAHDVARQFLSTAAPDYVRTGALADLHDVVQEPDSVGCYLWKRSNFYSKMLNHPKAWQLRWCTIDKEGFRSCRDRDSPDKHVRAFNVYEAQKVDVIDTDRSILKLYCPTGDLVFQAPNDEVLQLVVRTLQSRMDSYHNQFDKGARAAIRRASLKNPTKPVEEHVASTQSVKSMDEGDETFDAHMDEDVEDMLEWPESVTGIIIHLLLLPVKVCLYYTVPDVRIKGGEEHYPYTILMCFFWLAMFSFVMTECLETLGSLVGISPIIMGITFSAAGTSFPNVFASMVVARQGLGNCAVSNALGGNVFNVFMGLGLPWFFYTLIGGQDVYNEVFYGMAAGGVLFPVIILAGLLVGFMILLLFSGMRLYKWHAYLFIALYCAFLVWIFTGEDSPHNLQ